MHVGMNRGEVVVLCVEVRVPHARGDEPIVVEQS